MRFDALDIIIEGRGDATWLLLSGPFHREQIPNIKGKFAALLDDGNRYFIVDLEAITAIDPDVVIMFLTIANDIRAKGGELRLIFKNQPVTRAFAPYANLFSIFPDAATLDDGGFFGRILRRGRVLSKKTGIRLSLPVAVFLLFVLCGWFLSLLFIVDMQNRRIAQQQREVSELTQWKERSMVELNDLRERVRPLEQLGILKDTLGK